MNRTLIGLLAALGLAGCGIETAGTAATVAAMKAKEAKQGKETKEQVVKQLEEANQLAEQRLKNAEAK
jgi:ABC-type glycerol-3-phosphate transport system substrate-binding protein